VKEAHHLTILNGIPLDVDTVPNDWHLANTIPILKRDIEARHTITGLRVSQADKYADVVYTEVLDEGPHKETAGAQIQESWYTWQHSVVYKIMGVLVCDRMRVASAGGLSVTATAADRTAAR